MDERKCRGDDAFCMGRFQGVLKKGGLEGGQMGEWEEVKRVVKRTKMRKKGAVWLGLSCFSIPSLGGQSASEGPVEGVSGKNVKLAFRTFLA